MDRFEAMTMLVEVVERGSLSAAGRALRVPVATLSRKLSELEALLGTRLLIRTTRKLSLTDAGAAYVEAARRILEQVENAEREAAGEFTAPKGELIISAPLMFGRLHVLPVIADFLARFPDINVRLLLSDHLVHLVDDHVDMAVRIGTLPDSTLVATRVGAMRTVVCASPALLAEHGVPQAPEDLRRLPCVTVETPMPSLGWRFQPGGSTTPLDIPIVPRLSVTTTDAAAQAAIRGVGVTRLLYYQVADAVGAGALRIILDAYEPTPAPIHLIHAARGRMPLKMRRFLDFAAPRLRETLERLSAGAPAGAAG
ncbi:DNA-binding transcriptional LysR family regulator [Plasticicumulans lactativorans]|uniref:DNA-binding transcriptional LysR family regulator n=1 Tax=Plasticicumulans lactativorans TaxID=1133106 RepID=A0A4R2LH52_9GAMM|nr:LysR family transcriptional regulator [Plasticicumulans lactativorans]TCO82368.1 DNA-binding transcriptional LysR family regulator [Plasticicumulans lactativorans]